MKVGITGHQDLGSEETISWLIETLKRVIKQYGIDHGLTSLAVGADQLYAEILRKKHIRYDVIIPSEGYEKTFSHNYQLEKYIDLLQDASETIKLPFDRPTETAFYEAGKQVAIRSDMIIAIWNGKAAKGLGGTGDTVAYAQALKKPVVHLNPITRIVREI